MTFTNVLFPIDFSERSRAVVPHVRALCERFKAALTVLHVVHVPIMAYGAADAPVVLAELRESAEKMLVDFAAAVFPGMPLKTLVEEGDPGLCIADLAKTRDIDLIMMPTHGRGRFRAALLGSVTAKTLHDAVCPVWTAAHCEDLGANHLEWRNILCAIHTDAEGERLIPVAAELATSSNATVHLVHGVASPDVVSEPYGGSEFTEFLKDRARQVIAEMQRKARTDFAVCIESGGAREAVRHAAVSHRADLVLIGRGVLPRAGGLRSQAYAIVRDAPCPVLSV
jgi:nucleotide-binding universal stress UspA family protein